MIKNDGFSNALGILGIFLSFYLSTIQLSFLSLFPALMIIAGYSLQHRSQTDFHDTVVDAREKTHIALYTLVGIAGAFMANFAASYVITTYMTVRALSITQISMVQIELICYGATIAIAEEEFFRGFLLNFVAKTRSPPEAFLVSSLIFSTFHLAVYGTRPELLIYVFTSGMILSFISWKTQHVTTGMLAHMAVNMISYSMAGAIVG